MSTRPRIAIIGAGPIGLEAALYARLKGYDVTVYERREVANHVRQWGHVRMFSPFGMNSSEWGRSALVDSGHVLPETNAILTGQEFAEAYLHPLSRLDALRDAVVEDWHVYRVVRRGLMKHELVGDPRRGEYPFLLRSGMTPRWAEEFDCVLDCSGTFGYAKDFGIGGGPPDSGGVAKRLPDFSDSREPSYLGRHTMVVGSGYSAATNVVGLMALVEKDPNTRITWVTRHHTSSPIKRLPDDRLAQRDNLAERANAIATSKAASMTWISGCSVREVQVDWSGPVGGPVPSYSVGLEDSLTGEPSATVTCDRIIANVGYRPDRALYEELQVHECYATQGPMKLAAKLLGETSADCLDQTSHGPQVLRNPEPNFYILGMKSYGRNSNFLIQVGLQQIVDVFTLIESDWES